MGDLKEELAKWKKSRYQKPMSVALAEVRERHDCSKVHPGKRHQEWMNTEPVKTVKEEMFDEGRMKDNYSILRSTCFSSANILRLIFSIDITFF